MSSEFTDREYNYWYQFMLEQLKPVKFTELLKKVWILAGVSVVFVFVAANSEGGVRTVSLWTGAIWALLIPVVLAVILHIYAWMIHEAIESDDIEARKRLAPFAHRIKKFALSQEPYAYLLDITGGHEPAYTAGGNLYLRNVWEDWALDHRDEILTVWKKDWDEYLDMKASPNWPHARRESYPASHEGAEHWEHIWDRRQKIWAAAQNTTINRIDDHRLHQELLELGRSGTREQRKARLDAEFRKLRRELNLIDGEED